VLWLRYTGRSRRATEDGGSVLWLCYTGHIPVLRNGLLMRDCWLMMGAMELRIGVIGLGRRRYMAALAHQPENDVYVTAVADPRELHRTDFEKKIGAEVSFTADYREMLDLPELDAVIILSSDFLHEEHATAALEAGKHVYLEKPMAITIEGCDRILETARNTGRKVVVGHNMRHLETIRKMKDLVLEGAIGDVRSGWCRHFCCYGGDAYFKDWHAERDKSTSLLLQKACHDIDILHWLCDGATRRTTAMGNLTVYNKVQDRHSPEEYGDADWSFDHWPPHEQTGLNPVIDVEDLSMMLMELDNGVLCSYEQCHYTPDGWRNYTIIGTEGRIENLGDVPGESTVRLWNRRGHYVPEGNQSFVIPEAEGGHGGADPRIIDEFIRHVREDGPITTSPLEARASVAAGCAATHSLRNGNIPVDISPVPAETVEYFAKTSGLD